MSRALPDAAPPLRDDDVEAVTSRFACGAADWAVFGYPPGDDTPKTLALIRIGSTAVDGPLEATLTPDSITYGVFKVVMPSGAATGEAKGTPTSSDGKEGLETPTSGTAIVSFGFFGTLLHCCCGWCRACGR